MFLVFGTPKDDWESEWDHNANYINLFTKKRKKEWIAICLHIEKESPEGQHPRVASAVSKEGTQCWQTGERWWFLTTWLFWTTWIKWMHMYDYTNPVLSNCALQPALRGWRDGRQKHSRDDCRQTLSTCLDQLRT